jgi:hypothetical protein
MSDNRIKSVIEKDMLEKSDIDKRNIIEELKMKIIE